MEHQRLLGILPTLGVIHILAMRFDQEDAIVSVARVLEHYAKHTQVVGPEVRDPVRNAAIREHDWAIGRILTFQLKLKQMALERSLVAPGQDIGIELKLLLDDVSGRLPDGGKTHRSKMIKQCRLPHAGATSQCETSSVRLSPFSQQIHRPLFSPASGKVVKLRIGYRREFPNIPATWYGAPRHQSNMIEKRRGLWARIHLQPPQPKEAADSKTDVSYWVCSEPKMLKLLDWDKYWASSQSVERVTEETRTSSSFPTIDPQLTSKVEGDHTLREWQNPEYNSASE